MLINMVTRIQTKNNDFENVTNVNDEIRIVLKEYHKICDELDYDYEFHYVDDVKNNAGSVEELYAFMNKHLTSVA